jgi:hypothetical protein
MLEIVKQPSSRSFVEYGASLKRKNAIGKREN